ncbi:hypothetical protein [Qipengyuania sp.]|uniref:hypothetical protein n=1 Tax=Qipengyuania sp. TaxID=2004515 RepID=UPI003736145D
MAEILRDDSRALDSGEREVLALMIERLAELARGDIGGEIGRREIAAGHWKVRKAVERFDALRDEGKQKSQAKAIVADEQGLSVRTVDNYLQLRREREAEIERARAPYAIK